MSSENPRLFDLDGIKLQAVDKTAISKDTVFVISTEQRCSAEMKERLHQWWMSEVNPLRGHKFLLLDGGLSLQAYEPVEVAA